MSTRLHIDEIKPLYAFCDPHGGQKDESHKRLSSRAAIVLGGADALRRVFILHAWAARCSTDELIEKIYEINERWRPRQFGVEANGLQALFGDAIVRDAKLRGVSINLVPVMQPTHQQKDFRIRTTLQPLIGNGKLFLPSGPTGIEAKQEICNFPTSPVKDIIDAIASLTRMIPPKAPRREVDEERERKLAYLRLSGADPAYIQEISQCR